MDDDLLKRRLIGTGHGSSFEAVRRIDEMADEITRLRAEVERLKEAERTAWERGRDASANEIDAKCERACDYPDGCRCSTADIIRALTPEASHD